MWHGKEQAGGPLKSQLPDYGSATLYLYPKPCKHQLVLLFGAQTAFTGNVPGADPHPTVTGSAFSAEEPIPKSLKLSGDIDPDVYWGGRCPRKQFDEGVFSCYGFTSGEIGLCSTSDVSASNCGGPSDQRMQTGSRKFSWNLAPSFSKK